MELYEVLYADPPWKYGFSRSKTRKVENQYPTMTVADISALGPRLPIADDAVLYLWATAPKLLEALEVMRAWGFEYKTCAVWDKQRIGMGYYFRGRHELLLVGKRGNYPVPAPSKRVASVFTEVRRGHSRKPECVRRWIESAYPSALKLELFARGVALGWSAWGDEVPEAERAVLREVRP